MESNDRPQSVEGTDYQKKPKLNAQSDSFKAKPFPDN